MDPEQVVTELRADPGTRRIWGVALPYGVVASIGGRWRERFEAGGLQLAEPSLVNREHRSSQPLAVAEWHDTPTGLELRATLPAGARQDEALRDIAEGQLRGLSVEFRALAQRVEQGVRVVERYLVSGCAVAQAPHYSATQVELRAASLGDLLEELEAPRARGGDGRRVHLWL